MEQKANKKSWKFKKAKIYKEIKSLQLIQFVVTNNIGF